MLKEYQVDRPEKSSPKCSLRDAYRQLDQFGSDQGVL